MGDDKPQHLEFIQNAVSRMAANSFLLKGWSVTLAAGLFALAARDSDWRVAAVAFLPTIAFWSLDAYYLYQERLFRCLYDAVRNGEGAVDRFALDTAAVSRRTQSWRRTLLTPVVLGVHGPILIAVILVMLLLGMR